jgi:hypothetical protein
MLVCKSRISLITHAYAFVLVENKRFLCLLIFSCMLDEGNLEDKSVPHYLSLQSCTSSKIIGTTVVHIPSQNNENRGYHVITYTRKNAQLVTSLQTSCYKSVHKLSTSCVRTACSQFVVTSLKQAVNNL